MSIPKYPRPRRCVVCKKLFAEDEHELGICSKECHDELTRWENAWTDQLNLEARKKVLKRWLEYEEFRQVVESYIEGKELEGGD